ncbi:hypothetical protein GCM10023194_29600 [Planotetraspora phitsanulokensis]|uniref:Uncharacterized protein n=1 Tax=Planotetraspora phitsanulokensis TaxID=575192 RepID=A0A8J3XCA2_9ACTN|nr:hypothetical protein Pph01_09050 [Planotetraspora phitsanulokensis]
MQVRRDVGQQAHDDELGGADPEGADREREKCQGHGEPFDEQGCAETGAAVMTGSVTCPCPLEARAGRVACVVWSAHAEVSAVDFEDHSGDVAGAF